jgi:O-antigen/teichoic acid export membrane protein
MLIKQLKSYLAFDRRFSRDVFWNIGSLAILSVSGIVINTVVVRYGRAEALGVFNQVYAFYILLAQIGVGGVHLSVLKYISHSQDDSDRRAAIYTAALLLTSLLGLVVCLPVYFARGWAGYLLDSPGVSVGLGVVIPGLFFFALNKVLLAVVNGARHMRAFAVFNALRFLLVVAGVEAIIALRYPSDYLAAGLSLGELGLFVVLLVYVHVAIGHLRLGGDLRRWMGAHLSFGLRGCLSGVLSEFNTRVDVLVLGLFFADQLVGIYSFAAVIAEAISQIPLVVRRNVDPLLGRRFADGTIAAFAPFARQVKWIVYAVMGGIAVMAVAAFPLAVALLAEDAGMIAGWTAFAILMAGNVCNSGYRAFWGIMLQSGHPGLHTLVIFGIVTCSVILNFLLVPLWGIGGAAAATALVCVLEALLIRTIARRLFDLAL